MLRPRPLTEYPPGTLDALRGILTALLSYQDMLPTDLYVKLDLFRDDVTPPPTRSPAFTPHPGAPPRRQADKRM